MNSRGLSDENTGSDERLKTKATLKKKLNQKSKKKKIKARKLSQKKIRK